MVYIDVVCKSFSIAQFFGADRNGFDKHDLKINPAWMAIAISFHLN